ncbi:MAG TPA: response regulator [Stenotrophomonas sp.]|jgi:CheY-like chemotaxis protein
MAINVLEGRRVLVAEDEYTIAVFLSDYLEEKGVEVVGPVGSLLDAIDLVGRQPLDAALLDINLGGDLVYPLADRLVEAGVPFVLTSGYEDNIPARFAHYPRCAKPYRLETLSGTLESMLESPASTPADSPAG